MGSTRKSSQSKPVQKTVARKYPAFCDKFPKGSLQRRACIQKYKTNYIKNPNLIMIDADLPSDPEIDAPLE